MTTTTLNLDSTDSRRLRHALCEAVKFYDGHGMDSRKEQVSEYHDAVDACIRAFDGATIPVTDSDRDDMVRAILAGATHLREDYPNTADAFLGLAEDVRDA